MQTLLFRLFVRTLSTLLCIASLSISFAASEKRLLLEDVITEANLSLASEVADQIYRTIGEPTTFVVGLGRSPIIFVEFLKHKYEMDTGYIPISRIKLMAPAKIHRGLSHSEQENLDTYFDGFFLKWDLRQKKQIVFFDYAGSGISLFVLGRELSRYVKKRNLNLKVVMGSIESPFSHFHLKPQTPLIRIMAKDRIKTSFRLYGDLEATNLMTTIHFGRVDFFAPFYSADISKIIDGKYIPPTQNQIDKTLFKTLETSVARHVRNNPYPNPFISGVDIAEPQKDSRLSKIVQACRRILLRLKQDSRT